MVNKNRGIIKKNAKKKTEIKISAFKNPYKKCFTLSFLLSYYNNYSYYN